MLSRMGGRRPEKEIHKEKHAPQAPCALEPCGHPGFPGGSVGNESACKVGNWGSILGLGRSPGEGNGNPFQYSCLENPMDWGAWQAQSMGLPGVGHNLATKPPTTYQVWRGAWEPAFLKSSQGDRQLFECKCLSSVVFPFTFFSMSVNLPKI